MSDASSGSAASPGAGGPAPGSPQQEEAADDEAVIVTGSTSGGDSQLSVKLVKPAPIYHLNGVEFVVQEVTKNAIESFVVPDGFQQEGAPEDSFLFSLGNYCVF